MRAMLVEDGAEHSGVDRGKVVEQCVDRRSAGDLGFDHHDHPAGAGRGDQAERRLAGGLLVTMSDNDGTY